MAIKLGSLAGDNLELALQDAYGESDQEQDVQTLEVENSGKAMREKEHCIIAKIINFEQLKKANAAEVQEQWGVYIDKDETNAAEGQIRVRKRTPRGGEAIYEITTKSKIKDGKIETTVPTTEANFTQMKLMSQSGMIKHRYTFNNTDGTKWEVDVVPDGNGGYFPWGRIEIEVQDLNAEIPKLPITVEETIMPPLLGDLSQEEYDAKTKPLYDRFFVSTNPYLKEVRATPLQEGSTDDQASTEMSEGADDIKEEAKEEENPMTKEEAEDQKMSIENITDDKAKADKVEDKAEQIMKARGESLEDDEGGDEFGGEDTEGTEGGEGDGGEEATGETELMGEDTEGEEGKTDTEEEEGEEEAKVSTQSFFDTLTLQSDFGDGGDSANPGEGETVELINPFENNVSTETQQKTEKSMSDIKEDGLALQNAVYVIRSSRESGEIDSALSTLTSLYASYCDDGTTELVVTRENFAMAKNGILAQMARIAEFDNVAEEVTEDDVLEKINML